ncbi:peptidase domain-containing ABC transporter [Mesorhizobium sp.]|uniref:peptidase domain-containing ABC transporter n=1 Tax=Mesorhizobium sp. TaxID=1871066 RepID=UPI001219C2C0|nr:peptidase domain-containing ABC transporter [Mesorhizobium sp.]TIL66021.1 MAG: peptidase domain-containing ABC transporter [Mesorhizobium sp.]
MSAVAIPLRGRSRLPVIVQAEAAECGLACLAMIASYHGHQTDLNALRRRFPVSLKGVTLRGLIQLAANLHLSCRAVRLELGQLNQLRFPAVLHWDLNHFVVLKSVSRRGLVVHDPASGVQSYSFEEASAHLSGVAVEITPAEEFARADERTRLPFRAFWGHIQGAPHAVAQILALSVVLELLVIAAPFYMQLTIDEVIARGDVDLLVVLALGFGLLAAISVLSTALRSHIVLLLQNTLHFHMGARLFGHLVRLPLSFFEKRHIGDVLSRFGSLEPIRNIMAEGLIIGFVDGLMAVATLVMIFVYSPLLAFVVVGAVVLYAAVRLALYPVLRSRSETAIQTRAQENSTFIETARSIQSLKLFNREEEREGQWLNRFADVVNANVRLGKARITFKTLNDTIFGLENVLIVFLGAKLVLGGSLTVGMLFAFMAYKRHFSEKMILLVEKAIEFRLLNLHLERLADIALTPPERGQEIPLVQDRLIKGGIELRDVCFRYAETEPLVLENVSLTIEPGAFVTIMGPSGGGKTTLVKVILGLLEPTTGEVLADGISLHVIGVRTYREQVGAVMQDDQLLSGSIADNISFFDPSFDHDHMVECARLARIHDEISAMPMAYNTLIGDMGSSLSGGQKQRVLLARALYKRPKMLVLDEGTAHLDVENERRINASLTDLAITRISVAHRPEMMAGADRIIEIARTVRDRPWSGRSRSTLSKSKATGPPRRRRRSA